MSGTVIRPRPSLRLLLRFVAFDERFEPRALMPESCVEPVRRESAGPLIAFACGSAAEADSAGCMPQTSQKPSTMRPSQPGVTEHWSVI
jgi:hypothetical protein